MYCALSATCLLTLHQSLLSLPSGWECVGVCCSGHRGCRGCLSGGSVGKVSQCLLGWPPDGARDLAGRIHFPLLTVTQFTTRSSGLGERETGLSHTVLHGWGSRLTLTLSHRRNPGPRRALSAVSWAALGEGRCRGSQSVPLIPSNESKFGFLWTLIVCWKFSVALLDKGSVISQRLSISVCRDAWTMAKRGQSRFTGCLGGRNWG